MNLITFYFLIFVSVLYCEFALSLTDEEYLEKSILRSIRDKKGQFKSKFHRLQALRDRNSLKIISNTSYAFEDKYDYKLGVGEFNRGPFERYLYINRNKTKEAYTINYRSESCYNFRSYIVYSMYDWFLDGFRQTIPIDDFTLAGPNVLMELLLKNYENKTKNSETFECVDLENETEKKKCTILFSETTKFEYYLENKDDYTMVPNKIVALRKNNITGEWMFMNRYRYFEFTAIFDEESICSTALPIGFGCHRLSHVAKYYPNLKASYGGNEFLIKQDVTFNYLTPNDSDTSPCKFCKSFGSKLHLISRSYSNEMYVNQNESINIMKTIDEFTNTSIKTIYNYDKDVHTVHRVNLADDKCLTYSLAQNHSVNYFYIQDLFVNRKELFYSDFQRPYDQNYRSFIYSNGFSYLGDYKVNNLDYLVFESSVLVDGFRCFRCRNKTVDLSDQSDAFKNKNQIHPDKISAIFYFLKSSYSPESKTQIPSRIELRFHSFYFGKIANLTMEITSLENELQTYEKYDTSKCEKA